MYPDTCWASPADDELGNGEKRTNAMSCPQLLAGWEGKLLRCMLYMGTVLSGGLDPIEDRRARAILHHRLSLRPYLNELVAIQGVFPTDNCLYWHSDDGITVVIGPGSSSSSIALAHPPASDRLRKLRHPRVVGCLEEFEENGTEYLEVNRVAYQTLATRVLEQRPDRNSC